MPVPILHLYSPAAFHEPQGIAGNREGLERLMDAIKLALELGDISQCGLYQTSDGEGYDLFVSLVPESDVVKMALPYTEDYAKEHREGAVWPWGEMR